jgi:hypothetical protein
MHLLENSPSVNEIVFPLDVAASGSLYNIIIQRGDLKKVPFNMVNIIALSLHAKRNVIINPVDDLNEDSADDDDGWGLSPPKLEKYPHVSLFVDWMDVREIEKRRSSLVSHKPLHETMREVCTINNEQRHATEAAQKSNSLNVYINNLSRVVRSKTNENYRIGVYLGGQIGVFKSSPQSVTIGYKNHPILTPRLHGVSQNSFPRVRSKGFTNQILELLAESGLLGLSLDDLPREYSPKSLAVLISQTNAYFEILSKHRPENRDIENLRVVLNEGRLYLLDLDQKDHSRKFFCLTGKSIKFERSLR